VVAASCIKVSWLRTSRVNLPFEIGAELVPFGIAHISAVERRVAFAAHAGRAFIFTASRECGGVKRFDRGARWRLEGEHRAVAECRGLAVFRRGQVNFEAFLLAVRPIAGPAAAFEGTPVVQRLERGVEKGARARDIVRADGDVADHVNLPSAHSEAHRPGDGKNKKRTGRAPPPAADRSVAA